MFDAQDILDYWFGPLDDQGIPGAAFRNRWFSGGAAFDREIRRRFLGMLTLVSERELTHWRTRAQGWLAEIIVLDQFSRHIFRGQALAFAQDRMALECSLEGIRKRHDASLPRVQRAFFYMPFMHAEKRDVQAHSVELFEALSDGVTGPLATLLEGFAQAARDHQAIIAQFGRFPHRNQVLGRESTAEEREYLETGAARFGQ
ncbi:MAG: DUF924 domain-containing protein [Gammaproteobacteria bacterium]|nr:DUF924 domain-containing protein [Gammaproteobacteria bacterium]